MKTAILLIVFGGALLFAIAAAVFAYRSTHKLKKENETKQNAKETKPSAAKRRRWLPATAVIAVLGFGIWWVFLRGKPVAEIPQRASEPTIAALPNCDGPGIWVTSSSTRRRVPLRMTCWSPVINMPLNQKFIWDISRELHGVKFWDGTVWDQTKLLAYQRERDGWMGKVRYSVFRLLGKGEATIYLER